MTEPKPRKPVQVGTGMPATSHLEAFGETLHEAFGAMPYHVGSSIQGKQWRDVDVRVMLDDDRFHALFPGYRTWRQRDAWWALVCAGISELGRVRTGLPVDFQVQATSEANAKFDGPRNPLFIAHPDEGLRPVMLPDDDDDDAAAAACVRCGAEPCQVCGECAGQMCRECGCDQRDRERDCDEADGEDDV